MNRNFQIFLTSFFLIGFYLTHAQKPSLSKDRIVKINQLIEDLASKDMFSGVVFIANGNDVIYQKAIGYSDKQNQRKIDIHTKFNLASMNKMFTSVAISQLVEMNQLSYQDKLVKYLPELNNKIFGKITIAQLLSHTSGTGDFFRSPRFMEMKDTAKTLNSYLDLMKETPLLFEPGERFEYSNYGFILLGSVIERISKMSCYDYIRENIYTKASMSNSDSYASDQHTENLAIGYALPPPIPGQQIRSNSEKMEREPNSNFIEVKGTSAGGGYSTAIDLHKFSQALLTGKLISLSLVDSATKGRVAMPRPPAPPNAKPQPELKYGYGFGESFQNNFRVIGHTGGAPGIEAHLDIYPELGYTVVVLANYDRVTRPIIKAIIDSITAQ